MDVRPRLLIFAALAFGALVACVLAAHASDAALAEFVRGFCAGLMPVIAFAALRKKRRAS